MSTNPRADSPSVIDNPWLQLAIGVVCMACVANLQYGWTLFVNPIDAKYHLGQQRHSGRFHDFVLVETWLIPVEGYLVDRSVDGWCWAARCWVAVAWVINSSADFARAVVFRGGVGRHRDGMRVRHLRRQRAQMVSGTPRFGRGHHCCRDSGAGAAITIGPISTMINAEGYEHAFLVFGLIQGDWYSSWRGC